MRNFEPNFFKQILCLLFFLMFQSITFAQPDPALHIESNTNGHVKYEELGILPSSLHFYMFGDGTYLNAIEPGHQFSPSLQGYHTSLFTVEEYEDAEPTELIVPTGETTAGGTYTNPPFPMRPNVDPTLSWQITNYTESYVLLNFENQFSPYPSNGCVEFNYDQSKLDVNFAQILVHADWATNMQISNNKIKWDYLNLDLGEQRVIYIPVKASVEAGVNIPMAGVIKDGCSGPGLMNGLNAQVSAWPHDPNYLRVVNLDELSHSELLNTVHGISRQYLIYEVQFHNDGDANVGTVVVEDELSSSLIASTAELIYAEHTCDLTTAGNKLIFTFDDIDLPGLGMGVPYDQTTSTFRFRICTYDFIVKNDCIDNKVEIYFDNLDPISAENEICAYNDPKQFGNPCESNQAQFEFRMEADSFEEEVKLLPNPASDYIQIVNIELDDILELKIIGTNGQKQDFSSSLQENTIDLNHLSKGIYILEIQTKSKKLIHKKFVRL